MPTPASIPAQRPSTRTIALKYSLLSISLLLMSTYAIVPAVPQMRRAFPTATLTTLEFLVTLPCLAIMGTVLASAWFARRIGTKQTVAAGLVLVGAGGALAALWPSLPALAASRVALGLGIGLFNSLAASLISAFFTGRERTTTIGLQSSFQFLGGAALTLAASLLLAISWRATFLVYLAAAPILWLFWRFVPPPEGAPLPSPPQARAASAPRRLPARVWAAVFWATCFISFQSAFNVRISSVVVAAGYGTAAQAGTVLSASTVVAMCVSASFGVLYRRVGRLLLPVGGACMAAGFALAGVSSSMLVTTLGAVLTMGIGVGLVLPCVMQAVTEASAPRNRTFATSLVIVGCNVGALLAAPALALIGRAVGVGPQVLVAVAAVAGAAALAALGYVALGSSRRRTRAAALPRRYTRSRAGRAARRRP